MTRLIPIFISALCIGACASGGDPTAANNSAPADPAPTAVVDETETAAAPTEDSAQEELTVVDVPAVAQNAAQVADPRKDQRICRREVRTGTHRAVRVCRTRAEIERMEQESKEAFRDLHKSQSQQDLAEQISKH